jgi:hypothetical protein
MKCREESWQTRIQGLREQDATKLEQANLRSAAADEMAKKLSGT